MVSQEWLYIAVFLILAPAFPALAFYTPNHRP